MPSVSRNKNPIARGIRHLEKHQVARIRQTFFESFSNTSLSGNHRATTNELVSLHKIPAKRTMSLPHHLTTQFKNLWIHYFSQP